MALVATTIQEPPVNRASTRKLTTPPSVQFDFSSFDCLPQLFEERVRVDPEATAVVFGAQTLTYGQLNRRANLIAHRLRQCGIQPDMIVAVYVGRSLELLAGLLGVLKAGGAYLPLDPAAPNERLKFIIQDSGASAIVTDCPDDALISTVLVPVIDLSDAATVTSEEYLQDPRIMTHREDLAYVIYTSGSTGQPKGVMIEHGNLLNFLSWQVETFSFNASDRFLQRTTISFDASVAELWTPLVVGAVVVVANASEVPDPLATLALIEQEKVSVAQTVPSFLSALLVALERTPRKLPLRILQVGGEALPARDAHRWAALGQAELVNCYGPSECAVDTLYFRCPQLSSDELDPDEIVPNGIAPNGITPIGRPIRNTTVYVCDPEMNPVQPGEIGEIYLGGDSVGRGYLNRPELTSQFFLPNSFSSTTGGRLYRTGDMARQAPDGNVLFLGRRDNQVKVRGYRIELDEIQAAMVAIPGVDACVIVTAQPADDHVCLVAYIVKDNHSVIDQNIRQYLGARLPGYMIPQHFVPLVALPLLPNGKVNRAALPPLKLPSVGLEGDAPECDPLERNLLHLWRTTLGRNDIDLDNNFFDLGGHSLLALRLLAKVDEKFGQSLRLASIFEAPTVRKFAVLLTRGTDYSSCAVAVRSRGSCAPLFYVPGWGGAIIRLATLAKALPIERPFYVLDTTAFSGPRDEQADLIDVAHRMIIDMQRIQPTGPYAICGFSLGGIFAYEIARQLRSGGEEVAMLALLDTPAPGYPRRRSFPGRVVQHLSAMQYRSIRESLRHFQDLCTYWLRKQTGSQHVLFNGDAGLAASRPAQTIQACAYATLAAHKSYEPNPYDGNMVLVSANIREANPSLIDDDPLQGWGDFVAGGIEVRYVNCRHQQLVDPENAVDLSRALSEFL